MGTLRTFINIAEQRINTLSTHGTEKPDTKRSAKNDVIIQTNQRSLKNPMAVYLVSLGFHNMSLTLVKNILRFYSSSALTSCHSKSKTRGALVFPIWQLSALQEGKLLFQAFFCLCSKAQNNRHLRENECYFGI